MTAVAVEPKPAAPQMSGRRELLHFALGITEPRA